MSYAYNSTDPSLDDDQKHDPTYDDLKHEFDAVHARIRELELSNDRARQRIAELEQERAGPTSGANGSGTNAVALCAWHAHHTHSSTTHPTSPSIQTHPLKPGHLACGCTVLEALFEESLARFGVGSIHPEDAMMDPALRRPLLQLLQQRYDYSNGDLEHMLSQHQANGVEELARVVENLLPKVAVAPATAQTTAQKKSTLDHATADPGVTSIVVQA